MFSKDIILVKCRENISNHYIIISYVWGNTDDVRLMLIDRKCLYITASLESALRHVRDCRRVPQKNILAIKHCQNLNNSQTTTIHDMTRGEAEL